MDNSQKETIKWVAIVGIGGLILYNVGKKLGIFSDTSTPAPTSPNADKNTPTAKDYTHTPGFNAKILIDKIVNDWTTFGGDPFDILFSQIKSSVASQGDWQVLSNTFQSMYDTTIGDYITSWLKHAPWATVSKSELAELIAYINNLPL
jgi:hypothetical protein